MDDPRQSLPPPRGGTETNRQPSRPTRRVYTDCAVWGLGLWALSGQKILLAATLSSSMDPGLSTSAMLTLGLSLIGVMLALILVRSLHGRANRASSEVVELRAAAETLKTLLGTISEGVILTDAQGRIRRFNPAAEMLFGLLDEEARTLPVKRLIPDLDARAPTESDATDPTIGRVVSAHTGVRARGGTFPIRVRQRALRLDREHFQLILVEDLSELERSQTHMEYLQQRDPLTGLQNRKTFEKLLVELSSDPRGTPAPLAMCLIDIDRFKMVNDTCGHVAGDKLLSQLGQIVTARLPSATALARLGGDECVALFIGEAAAQAGKSCEDLVRTVRGFLFTWEERSFDITVSIGLSVFDPAVTNAMEALRQVDVACRLAKQQGRDRVHAYAHGDAESIRHRGDLALLPAIGNALSEDRFQVMAQPIMALQREDQPGHFEILVRMQDEHGDSVAPDRFIATAERHILMPAIDRWIISHVFSRQAEQLRAWHNQNPDDFLFAINLSGTTLIDEAFLTYIKRQFVEHGVPYPTICFEITETAAIANLRQARAFMQELRILGSRFAVDDFGTGFASYSYLKSLPAQYLKIDGSFVRNLHTDSVDCALTQSINHIGHVLGLQTIAEWAETPALIERLRDMGVDYAQGYGVGQPIALDQLDLPRSVSMAPLGVKRRRASHARPEPIASPCYSDPALYNDRPGA